MVLQPSLSGTVPRLMLLGESGGVSRLSEGPHHRAGGRSGEVFRSGLVHKTP